MTRKPQNLSHSIRDRLLQLARQQNEEFQNYLMRFALERWMYRLSQSEHQSRFILKGAMLFALWSDDPHRPTQDLDLLGFGGSSVREWEDLVRQICAVEVAFDLPPICLKQLQNRPCRLHRLHRCFLHPAQKKAQPFFPRAFRPHVLQQVVILGSMRLEVQAEIQNRFAQGFFSQQ